MMKASPRVMPITPRVAMNGGGLTITTSAEVTRPAATPTKIPGAGTGREPPLIDDKQVTGHDAGERDDGPGREVDAAADDDYRRANRGDAVDRRVLENQKGVLGAQKRMRAAGLGPEVPRKEQHFSDEDRHRAELAHAPELLHSALP